MSRATQLIKKLDKLLSRHDTFGDNPEAFVEGLLAQVENQLQTIQQKNKPEHWAALYVERDRASIKMKVLNKLMDRSSQ
ncbi:hypothetical protein [Synechococcus sp. MIT S9503]|uniref:hypothetical protein n=1 Tax=Synechococcus sp. MIT S9503 TaxID=3082547 RepID=UPI0039A4F189|tara:strand:- start:609 stop:845 length:237 start_codon:yes stop_codon:yes gene_type:complete